MNVEAMKQLRRVVEQAPEGLFNMEMIVDPDADCGTARCALGWAIVDPWFQQNTPLSTIAPPEFGLPGSRTSCAILPRVASEVFDVDQNALGVVFGYDLNWPNDADPHAITREDVIENIDRLLEGMEPEQYELPDDDEDDEDDEDD